MDEAGKPTYCALVRSYLRAHKCYGPLQGDSLMPRDRRICRGLVEVYRTASEPERAFMDGEGRLSSAELSSLICRIAVQSGLTAAAI